MRRGAWLAVGIAIVSVVLGAAVATWHNGLPTGLMTVFSVVMIGAAIAWVSLAWAPFRDFFGRVEWWYWAWAIYFVSGLTLRQRTVSDIQATALDSAAALRIALIGLLVVLLASRLLARSAQKSDGVRLAAPAVWVGLIGYSVFAVMSTLWSVYPSWTLYKSLEYGVGVILGIATYRAVVRDAKLRDLVSLVGVLYGALMISVLVGAVVAPSKAFVVSRGLLPFQLEGVLPAVAANGVAEVGAVLSVIAFSRLLNRERGVFYGGVLGFGLLAMFVAQGRSALAGMLSAALLMLLLRRRAGALLAFGAVGLGIALTSLVDLAETYVLRGQNLAMFASLSGRTSYWLPALTASAKNLLGGYGAYAAGRFMVLASIGEQSVSSLHNSWIETLVGTGVVGTAFLAVAVVASWAVLLRSYGRLNSTDNATVVTVLGLLTLETVRSVFTSGTLVWHPALKFLLVAVAASYAAARAVQVADSASGRGLR